MVHSKMGYEIAKQKIPEYSEKAMEYGKKAYEVTKEGYEKAKVGYGKVKDGLEVAKEKTAAGMVWTVETYEKVSDSLASGTLTAGSVGANIWEKLKAYPAWQKEAYHDTVEWCGKAKNETVEWYGNTKEKWDKLDLTWAKWPVDKAI